MNDYEQPRINYWDDQPDSTGARIVRFELTADLTRGSSANAKQLKWDGDKWEVNNRETLTVHDVFKRYAAKSGRRGWAIYSVRSKRWEILELATYGRIKGSTKAAVTGADAAFEIDGLSVICGVDPRTDPTSPTEAVTVQNELLEWADEDKVCCAEYNESTGLWDVYKLDSKCPE